MTKVAFGITCKNSSLTIKYVLSLLLMQEGIFERLFIIVDGGSSDDTLKIVQEILSKSNVQYIVESGSYTIPEGRNKILDIALKENCDYVLFVDADVVFRFRNLVDMMLSFASDLGENAIIHVSYNFLHFDKYQDAEKFMNNLLCENKYLKKQEVSLRPVAWSSLGFVLIPRKATVIRFDNSMTFTEDIYYGLKIWENDFCLYRLAIKEEIAFDINVGYQSDIYFSMGLKDYLKGVKKKIVARVYRDFDVSFTRFIKSFIKNDGKTLYHIFYTVLMIYSALTNKSLLLWISLALLFFFFYYNLKKAETSLKY